MKIKFLVLILFTNLSTGQKIFNKDYIFPNKELKVAIIPLAKEMTKFNDSISNAIFKDTLSLDFLKVESLRSGLNSKITDILIRIASENYKRRDLKKNPNLSTIINTTELNELKENLQNADLMLFPVKFSIGQSIGRTFGSATFRLYDLNDGEFIHQYETSFNVDTTEKGSKKMVTALLFLEEKNYLVNQKIE